LTDVKIVNGPAGTGGSTIKALEASTGAKFSIQDSGTVQIFAPGGCPAAADAVMGVIGGNVQVGPPDGTCQSDLTGPSVSGPIPI
jgi:hypothetical protein